MQVRFKLDAYNPAEFYGALGLLELLSQQDDGITSYFESDGATGANSTFVLHSEKDIPLPDLRAIKVTAKGFSDLLIAPVMVEATSFGGLELNWWLNEFRDDKNGFNMWAGTSRPVDMLRKYQQLMGEFDENVLQHAVKVKVGKSSFGFDTRASSDALMLGYSQKEGRTANRASQRNPEHADTWREQAVRSSRGGSHSSVASGTNRNLWRS